ALEKTVESKVGEKVGLPCCYKIPSSESLHNYRVYWQRTAGVVLAYAEGKKMDKDVQHLQQYENRTDMDTRNLTLWLSPVEIPDNGQFHCVVQQVKFSYSSHVLCEEIVTLVVTADFSMPKITTEVSAYSCESTEMVVRCSSHGGFPRPKISGVLNNVPVEWNVSWVSESSLSPYNVTAELQLNVTKDNKFTCTVEYSGFSKSTSLLLKKVNDCVVPTVPPPYNVITASSIIIIIFILAITLVARYLPRHVCSHCCGPRDSVEEGMKECTKPPLSSKVTSETSSV
ncbi:CD80 protein, partial [Podargus strigoides]|nr:CD80 protein [Podargus strigoides]